MAILVIAGVIIVWQLLAWSGMYPVYLFPPPLQVAQSLREGILSGQLLMHISASLLRFFTGYFLAALVAIPCGLFLGWYRKIGAAVDPLIQLLRPISPIAWFPLIALWFGIGELPAIIIIFIAAFFPLLLASQAAVKQVDPLYLKVARNFGSNQQDILLKVVIPASFPHIAMGLHLALGSAWVFLVAGEMLGVRSGLGFLIVDARNSLRTELVLAGILTIGTLGLLLDRTIWWVERYIRRRWGQVL